MEQANTTLTALTPSDSKKIVDAFLLPLLTERTEQARRVNPHYETLWQSIAKLYQAGGKRLRSYMTLLAYISFSEKPVDTILPAAAAQELLHLAMLIHDDVIDRDAVRYGVKNITGQYNDFYQEIIADDTDRQHYAESAAVLSGDLLISESYILLSETDVASDAILAAQGLLAKAMFNVIGGELLDTEAAFRGIDSADPLTIAEQKTASYSFVSPFLMGATLAGANVEQLDIMQKLGEQLGIAYQLRDDVIGVFGSTEATGKSTDSDLREAKQTFLIEAFHKNATTLQSQTFDRLFGRNDITNEQMDELKQVLMQSGARDSVEQTIATYQDYSHTLVDQLSINVDCRQSFHELINLCLDREK